MTGAAAPRLAVPRTLPPGLLAGRDPTAEVVVLAGATMGTTWRVQVALRQTPDVLLLPQEHARLKQAIQARLDGIDAEMSHWREDTPLMRFNRAAADSWHALAPDFATVVATALDIAARTGGAFDPALGRLTDLWGLGPNPAAAAPDAQAVAAARSASGRSRLEWDAAARRLRQPGGLRLDLSGIAKGFAVDAVVALLTATGYADLLVEIGGECAARGLRPDGGPWWVELEVPPGSDAPPLWIALADGAVATSGDYVRGRHMLDPATGAPCVDAPAAVSVVHASCMCADALATALTVPPAGEARALAVAEALPVRIVTADGAEWLSPALAAMLAD